MEGGDEVNVTGVGATGVGSTGVEIEVVVEGGVPAGWSTVTNKRHRSGASLRSSQAATKGAANANGKRTAIDLSRSPSQGAKRPRQVSPNCYEVLSPTGPGVVEGDVGPEVHVESHIVARRSQRRAQAQKASSEGLDAIAEALVTLEREQAARQRRLKKPRRHLNSRGESTSASEDSDDGDVGGKRTCIQVREAAARLRTAIFLSEMSNMPGRAIEGDAGVGEVGASPEDEERFSEAVADQGRWSVGVSSGGSLSPGSTGRSVVREPTVREHRRAAHGRSTRPARATAASLRLCCANHQCGKMFEGRKAKNELRYHFEIESVVCRPCEANYDHYKAYGLWRCETCDIWFDKQHKSHDCTKKGTMDMSNEHNRKEARQRNAIHLRASMKLLRDQRAGPRRHPEAVGADPFAGLQGRLDQAEMDVANNYRGGITARAEAEVQD